jgi:hypothetical protein
LGMCLESTSQSLDTSLCLESAIKKSDSIPEIGFDFFLNFDYFFILPGFIDTRTHWGNRHHLLCWAANWTCFSAGKGRLFLCTCFVFSLCTSSLS